MSMILPSRRRIVTAGLAIAGWGALSAAGGALIATLRQTAGPFYPDRLPLDVDNDLVSIAGGGQARGEVIHVFGRVVDTGGQPLPGAQIEIWQVDAFGRYIHSRDAERGRSDPNFQGFGRTVSDGDGGYRFRTIKPVAYGSRAPHIHVKVAAGGRPDLVSQLYIAGDPGNARDGIYNWISDPRQRAAVTMDLTPRPDLEPGTHGAAIDLVLD
ncbi:MAG: intradiol ring-cleavage dioxygenase [Alphaproteobacteria bacterium]|nr:intradiol ring-cleavage dioxygenase [Alphaproteobacteria bacterium]